jgi:hypothetical protein
MIGAAGGDVDDLDQPLRRMIAAELQLPALAPDQPGKRMIGGIGLDVADLDRAEAALISGKPAVDEQQPRPLARAVDPRKRLRDRAGRLPRNDFGQRREIAPAPAFVASRGRSRSISRAASGASKGSEGS